MGFRVWGLWFRGFGFKFWGLAVQGLGVGGSGFRVWSVGFGVYCDIAQKLWRSECRLASGIWDSRVSFWGFVCLGFRVFGVWGFRGAV